jgi:hypothetical protein
MTLNRDTVNDFHVMLYAGILETVTVLKRDDDQASGTVRSVELYEVRWSRIHKSGEPIAGSMSSNNRRTLHIPVVEMERAGIAYFNALDRFVDESGRTWQPESTTDITEKLFERHVCCSCLRVS